MTDVCTTCGHHRDVHGDRGTGPCLSDALADSFICDCDCMEFKGEATSGATEKSEDENCFPEVR